MPHSPTPVITPGCLLHTLEMTDEETRPICARWVTVRARNGVSCYIETVEYSFILVTTMVDL